jgi:pimeloyl-ACP methyl ester carboxylesterase
MSSWTADSAGHGQYADVNGLHMYYETYGSGSPLVLLHGGLGSGEMFGPALAGFTEHHTVILPDLQAHGRTADIDRPLDVRLMAGDIAGLIDHLGLERPDIAGFSLGGGVAYQVGFQFPEKIGRLVVASTNIRRSAIYPDMLAQQGQVGAAAAEFMKETPMYEMYQRVAPRPEDFPRLLDKIGAAMGVDFDFTEEVRGLRVPTLVMAGDSDMAPPSHYVEVFKLLDGGVRDGGWQGEGRPAGGHGLAILPRTTHYDLFMSPLFASTTLAFLAEKH